MTKIVHAVCKHYYVCYLGWHILHFINAYVFTAPPPNPIQLAPLDPCVPSPCGSNSQCQNNGGSPACSCVPTFIGMPPNCRPECVINSECPSNQACIRQKCRDSCPGSCGQGALCHVVNHVPVCTCREGYTGDPFTRCIQKPAPCKTLLHFSSVLHYKIL